MRFESPWALLLLPVVLIWIWLRARNRPGGRIMLATLESAAAAGSAWRARLAALPFWLRVFSVLLLIVALARPQVGAQPVREVRRGIAIEMVIDRSASMGEQIAYRGSFVKRLDVVRNIFREFVLGNGKDLPGRPDDLVGIISFARYAETVCPLTLSHRILADFLNTIHVADRQEEDGTAIGDALALAAARLRVARASAAPAPPGGLAQGGHYSTPTYSIRSKVIILLTDGHNNAGKRSPEQGAALARKWGIRIYTLGIGGAKSSVNITTPFGKRRLVTREGVDRQVLEKVAAMTGGKFWPADSAEKIERICADIDRLEKSRIEAPRYSRYSEKFTPFIILALALLFVEQALRLTVLRKIP